MAMSTSTDVQGTAAATTVATTTTTTVGDLTNQIHPIFARKNFTNISAEKYGLLTPALRLATRFITTDCLLDFAYAVFAGDERALHGTETGKFSHYAYFRPSRELTETDYALVKGRWNELADMVDITLIAKEDGIAGRCTIDHDRRGKGKLTGYGSKITIAETDLQILISPNPSITPESLVAAHYDLAVTLAHELMHAAVYATLGEEFPMPFERNTAAETGFEWEAHIFGGTVWKNDDTRRQRCVRVWPAASIIRRYQLDNEHVVVVGQTPNIEIRWAVRTNFLEDLFSTRFWEEVVPREGRGALNARGRDGIRVRVDDEGGCTVFNPVETDPDYLLGVPEGYRVEASGTMVPEIDGKS